MKMSVIFTGHGSPMNAIIENKARDTWKELGKKLEKPDVIIAISSHWETKELFVRTADNNPQINDMYGFPKELYEVHYEPQGSKEYARKALDLLGDMAKENNSWGIDHGIWSILSNMYPKADIPVVMISTNTNADAKFQYEVGKRLKSLRDENALILASGNVVHNLRLMDWDTDGGYEWADKFDNIIKEAILKGDFEKALNFKDIENWQKAIPTLEHYYPLLTALGVAEVNDKVTVFNDYRELGSMSMTSYMFEK